MASNAGEQPIIIKKKKAGHGGHHGGAWKVAYADFVTAMMAFFLLLWLLNVTTSDQRKGIADYFAPVSVSKESSGAGGMLGGKSISEPGAQMTSSSPMSADVPVSGPPGFSAERSDDPVEAIDQPPPGQDPIPPDAARRETGRKGPGTGTGGAGAGAGTGGTGAGAATGAGGGQNGGAQSAAGADGMDMKPSENRREFQDRVDKMAKQLGEQGQKPGESLADYAARVKEAMDKLADGQMEAKQFQQTANEIRQAIQSIPELQPMAQNLMIDQTPDGLRIQIVDQDRVSMFPGGSAAMYPQTRQLMQQLAQALTKLPNKLSISGHTDSTPFPTGSGRDNWDLSTERANATRRALMAGGLPESRIQDIVGKADKDLLAPDQPTSPRNRRISILLMREIQNEGAGKPPG